MVNSARIKDRMRVMKITQAEIAGALGIKAPTVSQKINNVRPMFLHEAEKIAEILEIGEDLFHVYFFSTEIA